MRQFLDDTERRVIANLSIPRNVADLAHELRRDPYVPTLDPAAVHEHLEELTDAGVVVNLGEHTDLAKLAASVEAHKTARTMPDEKAALYAARVSQPHRQWRAQGDVWMMTDAGFEMLHEPVPGASTAWAPKAVVEALLAEHGRRVVDLGFTGSIHDEDGGHVATDAPLAGGALLPEEFAWWSSRVIEAWNADHPHDPILAPLGGGAGYSDATELLILDADGAKTASYAESAPTYMALTTVAVTDADTGSTITEANYTGYARKSIAAADLNSAASGSRTNANAIIFAGCTAGTSTIIGFARCVAATVGRVIKFGTLASTVVSSTQTPAQFAAAAYTDTLD